MKRAPSWNKFVEHSHGDDDVVFGENHVRQVCSVKPGIPRNGGWPTTRYFNQGTGCGRQHIPEEDQPGHARRDRPKMMYMQQYVKEQGGTPPLQREQGGERHCDAR